MSGTWLTLTMLPLTLPCHALADDGSKERCGHDSGVAIGSAPTCRHHLLAADKIVNGELLSVDDPEWVRYDGCPKT